MRKFISRLEQSGELLRVKAEVSPNEEITEIVDRISKLQGGSKALLFENTATQFPVAINLMGSAKRIAMAMNVDSIESLTSRVESTLHEATSAKNSIWDKLRTLPTLMEVAGWLPKTSSSRGRCQDVILRGEDAKLSLLPILKCWPHDGGRFITLPMVNTIDPESGNRNVGMYRMQVLDDYTTGMHWHIHKTGARHYEGYKRQGRVMPISVAIGGDMAYIYSATAPMPDNMDEYLLAGFLRGRSVKLVKSITNDIFVPEDCDFVIEGYVDPSEEKVIEGPFGDHTGFYSLQDLYPKFHVTAITHRSDAIYPATIVGVPPQEDAYIAMASERIFVAPIRFAIMPEARDLYMPSAGTAHNIAMISIQSRYMGEGDKIIQSAWGAGQMMFNKYLLVAEHDTDIRNSSQVAKLLRNTDLNQTLILSKGVLDVLDHATATTGFGGKAAINLTTPHTSEKNPRYTPHYDYQVSDELLDEWGVLLLFTEPGKELNYKATHCDLGINEVNFIIILDAAAQSLSSEDILWLAVSNSDPRRDIELIEGSLYLDSRSKLPSKSGNPARFPNVVTSSDETIQRVDSRWEEYGLGKLITSPSLKYKTLLLSDKEDW
ncbi:MAG: menaquinone biosynthesis decarboxylase [Rikenellaceae bacterium]